LGEDFDYEIKKVDFSGISFDFSFLNKESPCQLHFQLSTPATYQVENASLALAAINLLKNCGFKTGRKTLRNELTKVEIPGRFEIVQKKPLIILDGAHNPTKIKVFLTSLTRIFPNKKFIFVVACKRGKDTKAMLARLVPHSKAFVITGFSKITDVGKRFTTPPDELEEVLTTLTFSGKIVVEKNSSKALNEAKRMASSDDVIIATGSLYLVGEIRDFFFPKK
jgi:dihydrofolate synthase/folylpolyglutamate synthase